LTVILEGGIPLELIKIKAGSFTMGSSLSSEVGMLSETPHQVTLTRDYWIGKYEVTEEQFDTVTKWPRCDHDECGRVKGKRTDPKSAYPVGCVSWRECMRFCVKLTEYEKRMGRLPEGYIYLLPTEAQWEYACKSENANRQSSFKKERMGWFKENAKGMVHPIGQKQPNARGLYDMLGNLSEWCLDSGEDYSITNNVDPLVFDEPYRIYRGGSIDNNIAICTCEWRSFRGEGSRGQKENGFRIALVPIPADKNGLYEYLKGNYLFPAD
jgi:formylglycine-generating enzyme required for sulfatase activity